MTELLNLSNAARLAGLSRQTFYDRQLSSPIDAGVLRGLIIEKHGADSARLDLVDAAVEISEAVAKVAQLRDEFKNKLEAIDGQ